MIGDSGKEVQQAKETTEPWGGSLTKANLLEEIDLITITLKWLGHTVPHRQESLVKQTKLALLLICDNLCAG
jgi:hypothetical protein